MLHGLDYVLNYVNQRILTKVYETIEHHQGFFIGDYVAKETEEGVGEECLQDDISRFKVDIQMSLSVDDPIFDVLDKSVQLLHAISVEEAPLSLNGTSAALCKHFLR